MAEKRLVDANELEEKAIYITGPKGSACHAVPLGLIQAAPTIDPETLRPTAHIIRGYVPETKDGVFCDGCNHCLGWEYGAHVIGYFKYCPYCGDRLENLFIREPRRHGQKKRLRNRGFVKVRSSPAGRCPLRNDKGKDGRSCKEKTCERVQAAKRAGTARRVRFS